MTTLRGRGGGRSGGRPRWGPRRAVALLGLLLCAPTLGQPTDARKTESVVDQLRRQFDEVADRAQRAVDRMAAAAEEEARDVERPVGVSFFTPAAATAWTPLAPGAAAPERVVLLIHGLDEPGSIWDDAAPALERDAAGRYGVARFEYPNDQSPAATAPLLAGALRDLAGRGAVRVDLVCHSMGGLIARDVLTRAAFYGGDATPHAGFPAVERLIMVGTPHAGSPWSKLRAVGEIREQIARFLDDPGHDARGLLGFLNDGLGEAGDDLLPGSPYLRDLNARPLPTGVAMTVVVGRFAPLDDADLKWLSESFLVRQLLGAQDAAAVVRSIEELSTQLGDGVVPEPSAILPGVGDTLFVEANHRTMLKSFAAVNAARRLVGEEARTPPAIPIIIDRIAGPARSADKP